MWVEVCDVCGKQVVERDGITLRGSDVKMLSVGTKAMLNKRDYKVRICNKCVKNIKEYCRKLNE